MLTTQGGGFTYNGHDALDITVPNFAASDAGVPIFAAAAGTVNFVEDRQFDRCSRVESCSGNENWIRIEHANGFETRYVHIRRNSALVQNGQSVVAGQQIALMGSSGISSDPHLHFTVVEDGNVIETYQDPTRFWNNPLPYAGNGVRAIDWGFTHQDQSLRQLVERPSDNDVFFQSDGAGQQAHMWIQVHSLAATDTVNFRLFRPNGTQWANFNIAPNTVNWGWLEVFFNLPAVPDTGAWNAVVTSNGNTLVSDSFVVRTAPTTETWEGATGNWFTGENWFGTVPPTAGEHARIVHDDGGARTITYNGISPILKSLWIDLTGPGTNRVTLNNAGNEMDLVEGFVIGDAGRATFNHTGGRITSADPNLDSVVGYHTGGDGIYNMSGNAALYVSRDLYIGAIDFGKGAFNQMSGTTTTGSGLILGSGSGSIGTYNLSGGTLNITDDILVANSGTGALSVTGGSEVVTRTGATIGHGAGSIGSISLNGPRVLWHTPNGGTGVVTVGNVGQGTLSITGGALMRNVRSVVGLDGTRPDARGNVAVSGIGSLWEMTNDLIVAHARCRHACDPSGRSN